MFMLSFFEVPRGVLEKLEYYRSRFFWQSDNHKKKYRLAKWSILISIDFALGDHRDMHTVTKAKFNSMMRFYILEKMLACCRYASLFKHKQDLHTYILNSLRTK